MLTLSKETKSKIVMVPRHTNACILFDGKNHITEKNISIELF